MMLTVFLDTNIWYEHALKVVAIYNPIGKFMNNAIINVSA